MPIPSPRAASRAIVWLLMLTLLSMGLVANGLEVKRLAHELDHGRDALAAVPAEHDHSHGLDAQADADDAPLGEIEHQFLHSACHAQPLLASAVADHDGASPVRETPIVVRVLALPPVAPEPPFRPPRSTART